MSAVPPTRFRQETRVAWRSIDGESVLIDPTSGTVFVLNRVGSQVWALLEEPRTVEELAASVGRTHDRAPASVADDVETFLTDLADRSLIEETT